MKSNLKKKKKMELEFHVKFFILLDFRQIEFFLLKLDFLKIEFQNKGILLDRFRIWAFCYIFWTKKANAHFGLFTLSKNNNNNNNNNSTMYLPWPKWAFAPFAKFF